MASRAQPPLWRETMKAGAVRSSALLGAIFLFTLTILMIIALASYHSGDPSLNTASGGPAQNWLGPPGAWFADLAFTLFGPLPTILLLPVAPILATRLWRGVSAGRWRRMLISAVIGVALIGTALSFVWVSAVRAFPAGWGGLIGLSLADLLRWGIDFIGDPVAILWTGRAAGLLAGVAGAVIYVRALQIPTSKSCRPNRRASRQRGRNRARSPSLIRALAR